MGITRTITGVTDPATTALMFNLPDDYLVPAGLNGLAADFAELAEHPSNDRVIHPTRGTTGQRQHAFDAEQRARADAAGRP